MNELYEIYTDGGCFPIWAPFSPSLLSVFIDKHSLWIDLIDNLIKLIRIYKIDMRSNRE